MKFLPVTIPTAISKTIPGLCWNIPSEEKSLYLTFDDGPTPGVTPWVLDCLDNYNAKATFFCIGSNVEKYPEIYQSILAKGHAIGNHSHTHLKGWKTDTASYIEDILKAEQLINSELFRPPYGQITPKQIKAVKKLGFQIVMWTVLSVDWDQNIPAEKCLMNVTNNAQPGNIIVFHDSIKAENNMKFALEGTLKSFSERGFEFKRIPG